MKYTMRYFEDHKEVVPGTYATLACRLDGHTIAVIGCDRCSRRQYYYVVVDGKTIKTRCLFNEAIRFALDYLNHPEIAEK